MQSIRFHFEKRENEKWSSSHCLWIHHRETQEQNQSGLSSGKSINDIDGMFFNTNNKGHLKNTDVSQLAEQEENEPAAASVTKNNQGKINEQLFQHDNAGCLLYGIKHPERRPMFFAAQSATECLKERKALNDLSSLQSLD
ncbi:hypothetical protein UY3_07038 [Chelonia mydas]|uniref:Uncharacterized protein n=1 Tax=Chelonia mydas TaxID=8469 RepID=M7BD14_CHEMY|nr:hypothetical protein UY3_07038 [Chelonia mydas]